MNEPLISLFLDVSSCICFHTSLGPWHRYSHQEISCRHCLVEITADRWDHNNCAIKGVIHGIRWFFLVGFRAVASKKACKARAWWSPFCLAPSPSCRKSIAPLRRVIHSQNAQITDLGVWLLQCIPRFRYLRGVRNRYPEECNTLQLVNVVAAVGDMWWFEWAATF